MELLLTALKGLPVYGKLISTLEKNRHVGLSGAAQLGRSHLIASVIHDTKRPALILCQDEMAARRTQEELKSFLDKEIPILPSRDLGFYSASAISRQFEQKRLKLCSDAIFEIDREMQNIYLDKDPEYWGEHFDMN